MLVEMFKNMSERGQAEWLIVFAMLLIFLAVVQRGGAEAVLIFLIMIGAIWWALSKGEKAIKKRRGK
jgi:cbb3-type cytochrome oxidase subunit 3